MKKILLFISIVLSLTSCNNREYEYVKGDITGTRIYTLDNGLKVYLAKNTDEPRITAIIAVRVGSKNDPKETTGLAHYFEHLMFKGTEKLGTKNYDVEKPMLDSIETMFEIYRKETDRDKRAQIYRTIDSISQRASKIAVPNEYDKVMAAIGSDESNAWTSTDETCYIENFPSNELERWAIVQSDRFQHPVIRGFHTELETIYEEYNMYAAMDYSKLEQTILSMLFPEHPYGTHDVIGTPEHLKNPSITNVKNYYSTYYVPNNYAICMSGDLDFDRTMDVIERWFGGIKPNKDLPKWKIPELTPITEPLEKEIYGLESESVAIAWRGPRATAEDENTAKMASEILSNGQCGIIDEDLLQTQTVMEANADYTAMADEGEFVLYGTPKEGQTLEEVKQLLLDEVVKLSNGNFDEKMIAAEIANRKRKWIERSEHNSGKIHLMVDAFINGRSWQDVIANATKEITKEQISDWAKENLRTDNYIVIYKRQGIDPNDKKIEKPHITPTASNRDDRSPFLDSIVAIPTEPILPVFADFNQDMKMGKIAEMPFIYKQNCDNSLFTLKYVFETGSNANPALDIAVNNYFPLLGTETKSAMEIQKELYSLALDFNIRVKENRTEFTLRGLGENMQKGLEVVEDYIKNVKGDNRILSEVKRDFIKGREDAKFDQDACYQALRYFCTYGKNAVSSTTISNNSLKDLSSEEMLAGIKDLMKTEHRIFYYGPLSMEDAAETIADNHVVTDLHKGKTVDYPMVLTNEDRVIIADYDSKQVRYIQMSCDGMKYNPEIESERLVFNKYFGSDIVYQELREARGLAYTARARYESPDTDKEAYNFWAYIGTQNDKVQQAVETFDQIIENMPESDKNFSLAKDMLLSQYCTKRYPKASIFDKWVECTDLGLDHNPDPEIYEKIKRLTLEDLKKFHSQHVQNRKYVYTILGNSKDIDMTFLKSLGDIKTVSQEDYFGY